MKTIHAKSGPLPKRPYYKDYEIEQTCTEELRRMGLLPDVPSPIRIDRFIEKRFGISHQYENLPSGILGFTRFNSNGVEAIIVSDTLDSESEQSKSTERRLRTTLAHEAGHGLLHAQLFAQETKGKDLFDKDHDETPRIFCRDTVPNNNPAQKKYDGKWWEFHANKAMAALLMPKILVEKAMIPFLTVGGFLGGGILTKEKSEEAAVSLAEIFDVNPVVARFRIADLYPLTGSGQLSL